jgi:hypothetical protein
MSTYRRAVRLALIVEGVSCVGMLFEREPREVADALVDFFSLLNLPVLFLLFRVRGNIGFEVYNGRLVPSSIWGIVALLVQCALWSLVFFGLLHLGKKARLRVKHHDG